MDQVHIYKLNLGLAQYLYLYKYDSSVTEIICTYKILSLMILTLVTTLVCKCSIMCTVQFINK